GVMPVCTAVTICPSISDENRKPWTWVAGTTTTQGAASATVCVPNSTLPPPPRMYRICKKCSCRWGRISQLCKRLRDGSDSQCNSSGRTDSGFSPYNAYVGTFLMLRRTTNEMFGLSNELLFLSIGATRPGE